MVKQKLNQYMAELTDANNVTHLALRSRPIVSIHSTMIADDSTSDPGAN